MYISEAGEEKATREELMSNCVLEPAIALFRSLDFEVERVRSPGVGNGGGGEFFMNPGARVWECVLGIKVVFSAGGTLYGEVAR